MTQLGKFTFTAEHEFFYNTKEPVPIADVIEALQGLERLLRNLPKALEKATEISIIDSQIFVQTIESGSLLEKIGIKLFFNSEEDMLRFVDKIRTKMDGSPMLKRTIIGVLISGVVITAVAYAAQTTDRPISNITANNNVIINVGAGEIGWTADSFRSFIDAAIGDKKEMARAATRFVKPARSDQNSTIVLDGMSDIGITAKAIAETPDAIHIDPITDAVEYENVVLLIRAGDMDQAKSGWAGAIQGMTERLPIELDPALSPAQLFGRTNKQVTADVAIVRRQNGRSGSMVPKSIFVRKIHN